MFLKLLFLLFLTQSVYSSEIIFDKSKWKLLTYSSLPPNQTIFNNKTLTIKVDQSASPIIYPLEKKEKYRNVSVKAIVTGNLNLKEKEKQGDKGNDDFRFRLGLVYEGERTLSFFQRVAAAKWIKTLFDLNKDNTGIHRIVFYNTYTDSRIKNQHRVHPLSDLLEEKFMIPVNGNGEINFQTTIDSNRNILALWLSSDGDDTKSKYKIVIKEIKLGK